MKNQTREKMFVKSQRISESTRHPVHGDTLSYIQRLSTESGRWMYNVMQYWQYWPKWEFGQKWSKILASSGDTLPQNPKLWWNPLTEISCRIVSMWQWTIFDIDWRQDALPEDHQQSRPDSTSRSRQSPRCTHTQHCSRTAVMEEYWFVENASLVSTLQKINFKSF